MANSEHPLKNVSLKVLEDWGLMLVDELKIEEIGFDLNQPLYMAWINMHGSINGALSIVAQKDFMTSLATNLLGEDESYVPSTEEGEDALKEMSNVLAGNFFTEAYGDATAFDLINPEVGEIKKEELDKVLKRRVVHCFSADGQPVAVTFSIRD